MTDWDTAKCRGRVGEWDISVLGRGDRDGKAKRLCSGCPVLIECATTVYANPDTVGVVAAGLVINGDALTPNDVRRRLAELLDVPYVPAAKALKKLEATA